MTDLHLWHSDKNFNELAEAKYPESSGIIYNLYEDCIVQREEIERLNARVNELEFDNKLIFGLVNKVHNANELLANLRDKYK